jgi:hypothetical protein
LSPSIADDGKKKKKKKKLTGALGMYSLVG